MKTIILIIIILQIIIPQISTQNSCSYCKRSINDCSVCYLNCGNITFQSCDDGENNLDQATCIHQCCDQDADGAVLNGQILHRCFEQNNSNNSSWITSAGYFAVLSIGSATLLILIVIIARGIYVRCTNRRALSSRRIMVLPNIPSYHSINPPIDQSTFNKTNSQIHDKLKNYPNNSNQLMFDQSNTCCICLQNKVNSLTKCGHVFHLNCLCAWSHRRNSCPLCSYRNIEQAKIYCVNCKNQIKEIDLRRITPKQMSELSQKMCSKCKK